MGRKDCGEGGMGGCGYDPVVFDETGGVTAGVAGGWVWGEVSAPGEWAA